MMLKVCIDAGHYGKYNRSPVVKEYYESDMNWKLHLLQKKYLEQYGIEVILTRNAQEKDMELTVRGTKAKGCDLFLSDHSNAAESEEVDYPVVYVPLNGTGDVLGKKLADCIATVMGTRQAGKTATRKGQRGEYYGVLRGAAAVGVPGLILEHSFHTNKQATEWLLDDTNLDKLAQAEAAVIAQHYGINKPVTAERKEGVCTVEIKVLKKGAKGATVKAMQTLLIGYGFSCGEKGADGSFGGDTDKALRAYQKAKGLDPDASCGPATWASLLGVG